jgi:hypothetical protein
MRIFLVAAGWHQLSEYFTTRLCWLLIRSYKILISRDFHYRHTVCIKGKPRCETASRARNAPDFMAHVGTSGEERGEPRFDSEYRRPAARVSGVLFSGSADHGHRHVPFSAASFRRGHRVMGDVVPFRRRLVWPLRAERTIIQPASHPRVQLYRKLTAPAVARFRVRPHAPLPAGWSTPERAWA